MKVLHEEKALPYKTYDCIGELQMYLAMCPNSRKMLLDQADVQYPNDEGMKLWFVVTKDGQCNLIDEQGELHDIPKMKYLHPMLLRGPIKKLIIPSGVAILGTYTIADDSFNEALESIVVPSSVKTIESYALSYLESLKNVQLSEGIARIGTAAFIEDISLESIAIPESVGDSIGNSTFDQCYALKHVKLPSRLRSIPDFMFHKCFGLKTIDIPKNCEAISRYAFEEAGLEKIELPESMKSIGIRAFAYCSALKQIIMPASIKEIRRQAFYNCKSLKEVVFKGKTLEKVQNMGFYPWGIEDESIIKCEV